MKVTACSSILALALLVACERKTTPPPSDGFDRNALTVSITDRVVMPLLDRFVMESSALDAATERAAMQSAWRKTTDAWQQLEMLQLGPTDERRDRIHPWPTVNACVVDQETLKRGYEEEGFFTTRLVTAYGLTALEYLLFRPDGSHACTPVTGIDGAWSALGEVEVAARRLAYADRLSSDIAAQAVALREAWSSAFADELRHAGQSGSRYNPAQEAIDAIFAALYYLELVTKDQKLAVPAGLSMRCVNPTCPELLEAPWARYSKENVRANLLGFSSAFFGGERNDADAVGFDEFLRHRGAADLADRMAAALDAALASVDAVSASFEEALVTDPESVRAVYEATKGLTDLLKTELVTTLNLRVPQEGAGDND